MQDILDVDGAEVLFSSGETREVPFGLHPRTVPLANAECEATATASYFGNGTYLPETSKLRGGVVAMSSPRETYFPLEMRIQIGIGHEVKPVYAGSDEATAQSIGEGAQFLFGGTVDWAPRHDFGILELLLDTTAGRREYLTQDSSGARSEEGVAMGRGLVGIGGGVRLPITTAVLGISGGFGGALGWGDRNKLPYYGLLAPFFRTRFSVTHSVAIAIGFEFYLLERTRVVDPSGMLLTTLPRNRAAIQLAVDFSLTNLFAGALARARRDEGN